MYKINGYNVVHTYAGIDQYTVYNGRNEIGTCWDLDTVAKWTKTNTEAVIDAMWKQRH